MREFFAAQADDEDEPQPNPADLARMLEGIEQRRNQPASPDTLDEIRAWLAARD